jgi:membrane-bound lytic murein transglycosylase D
MVKRKRIQSTFITSITILFIVLTLSNTTIAFGQGAIDSSKQILLASANIHRETEYIIKPSNVVFPDILKGNEEMASDYIASFSSNRRDYLVRMHEKGEKFLPKANVILKKYNLPEEFSILMVLESAFNANAISKAGAVGYWQFMDEVAKEYGLKYVRKMNTYEKKKLAKANTKKRKGHFKVKTKQKDDRKNFDKSTLAAARYLRDRGQNLDNNWLLIVASYNCGVGNVWNAMKKTGKENPDFWDIKKLLPAETQAYVMNFITLNVIYKNYDNFISNNLNFTPVKIVIPSNFEPISFSELVE